MANFKKRNFPEKNVLLPYPPSTNRLWRYSKNRVYRTSNYIKWIDQCHIQLALQGDQGEPFDAPVRMLLSCNPPDNRIRDIDNLAKPLCDIAEHLKLVRNDHWIHDLRMRWDKKNVANGVMMTITLLSALHAEA